MSDVAIEALLGGKLRNKDLEEILYPEVEALLSVTTERGLSDSHIVYKLRELLTEILHIRRLNDNMKVGYAAGIKHVPLDMREILRQLLG